MNVYRFYFSTASNSPTLVPFSATCSVRGGVCALLAIVTQIETPPKYPPLGKQVLIGMPEYPVLS